MREETPVARSSLVPILGCIALLLFGLNFYRFLDREFFSKWKHCDGGAYVFFQDHEHRHHEALAFESGEVREGLRRAERALRRNLERAERAFQRLRQKTNGNVAVDLERLREDIHIKQQNLERLRQALQEREHRPGHRCQTRRDAHRRHIEIRLLP